MTETPDGTPAPQHATTPRQDLQDRGSGRHPYAGPGSRQPEADPITPTPDSAGPERAPDGSPWRPAPAPVPLAGQTEAAGGAEAAGDRHPWRPGGPEAAGDDLRPGGTRTPEDRSAWRPSGREAARDRDDWRADGTATPRNRDTRRPGGTEAAGDDRRAGGAAYQGGQALGGYGYAGGPAPFAAGTTVVERPRRGPKRMIAVGALVAVLGGLAGGGAVAAFDGNETSTTVVGAGLNRDTSAAPAAADDTATVEAAAATALRSVVTLSVRGSQESGTGSGVIIRADGYILTNQHVTAVADNGGAIAVTLSDGRTATATLVGEDSVTDLAVVKANLTGLPAATFADSDAVKIGQTVVAVGSPLGLNGTVTEGIVSALHRATTGGSDGSAVIDALQTDAAINPGNSGGALVDLAGRVVGINQSIATASSAQQSSSGNIGIGFAIPSNTAEAVATQLIDTGKAVHAFLGVQAGSDQQQSTTSGAPIASVQANGPAAAAGLQVGDVVTRIGSRSIADSADLVAAVRSYAPGDKVTLTVRRGTATRTIAVTLGSDAGQE